MRGNGMKKFSKVVIALLCIVSTSAFARLNDGDPAPDFTLPDVSTGQEVCLSDFKGQVVVLQFWKVCAGRCRKVVPQLNRLQSELLPQMYPNLEEVQAEHGSLLKVLSVNVINPPRRVLAEMKGNNIEYQVLEGRNTGIARDYQLITLPMVFIIDKDGIIRYISAFPQYEELKDAIIPLVHDIVK